MCHLPISEDFLSAARNHVFDGVHYFFLVGSRVEVDNSVSIAIDEELCEIPRNLSSLLRFCVVEAALAPQELEVVCCLSPVHVVLVQQWEPSTVALHSLLFDIWIRARFLSRKLIARLRDYLKTFVFKRYVQVI